MHSSFSYRSQLLPLLALAAALALPSAASSSSLDCAHIKASGNTYDLHSLPSPVVALSEQTVASKVEQLRLELSLCSALPFSQEQEHEARGPCPKGTRACLRVTDVTGGSFGKSHNVSMAGHGEDEVAWSAELGEAIQGSTIKPLNLTLQGSKYAEISQSTQIEFICDKLLPPDAGPSIVSHDSSSGLLRLRWATPHACPTQTSAPDSGKDSKEKEKEGGEKEDQSDGSWGLFSWLFFFLFVGAVVWLGMGIFRNWNDNGQISLPSSDYLREAPFLARDLARHVGKTFSSVSGRGGSGGYEPV